ncbi:MAG: HpcH/HpaI aldolase/citrate lyase family protein [Thermoplasmatota archaeon]
MNPASLAARRRRSVLFCPADNASRSAKALASGADSVVLDLEDAVGPAMKAEARKVLAGTLGEGRRTRTRSASEVVIRVNALASEWFADDIVAAVALAPDAILVPKIEGPGDVRAIDKRVSELESSLSLPRHGIALHLLFETARGVLTAFDCASASSRTAAIFFGAEDLAADIGARRTAEATEVLYARSHVALVAGALKLQAIDQVFIDFKDTAGCEREARFARTLGYMGKMIIHPAQIEPVHRAFSASAEEVARAERILAEAEKSGGEVFQLDGHMIDRPLMEQARRLLGR